eukprot:365806-Chlamydomonas_euryale.AAC.24
MGALLAGSCQLSAVTGALSAQELSLRRALPMLPSIGDASNARRRLGNGQGRPSAELLTDTHVKGGHTCERRTHM